MSKISVEFDDSNVKKWLSKLLADLPPQGLMERLGLAAERLIKKRTRKGIDVEGDPFQDYSEGYKKVREKVGLPTHPVNLTFNDIDGMMMKVDHIVARDFSKVLVFINDSRKRQIARYHNILGAGKSKVIRRFMGLNKEENRKLNSLAQQEVKNLLKVL